MREAKLRRDRDAFVKFPWRIYPGDKNWSPPLLLEAKAFIDPAKHPFCKHGTATQFLAFDQGQLVGRIQASDDPNYNRQHGTNVGCFGMFEALTISCLCLGAVGRGRRLAQATWPYRDHGADRLLD